MLLLARRAGMRWQSAIFVLPCMIAASGCALSPDFKDAEPEKYMGLDCEQLEELAESYRTQQQFQLFNDGDISEMERRNIDREDVTIGQQYRGQPNYEVEWERDRRSITLARRQKGCI